MPFKLNNVDLTYQRSLNILFHDRIGKIMEVYINDVVAS